MIGRGSRLGAARLLGAAATIAFVPVAAPAQTLPSQPIPPQQPADPAELDPSAPLDAMPDLGVAWPQLNPGDTAPPPVAAPASPKRQAKRGQADGSGDIRYTVQVEGLAAIGDADDLLHAFREQSALQAEHKDPANAAQIGRRAGADADLLAELLRAQGYYDAVVEPRTEKVGGELRVVLTAEPGAQYRFASVDLPGIDAAGPDAAKLRDAFAVKPGDPVIAGDVIAGGIALTLALGEEGFAEA
jgi:translocation and assembly module TamA